MVFIEYPLHGFLARSVIIDSTMSKISGPPGRILRREKASSPVKGTGIKGKVANLLHGHSAAKEHMHIIL
jgi:hypothetical protein